MSTAVQVIPNDIQVPAYLQTPDIVAAIAAANAAAAGGVRAGRFPSISIKANRFSIRDGDETTPLMTPPAAPGQPALPMGCLEVVVVAANPALSHTYYAEEWVEGENKEPACRSANGITPDADVASPQNPVCATCPQYQWGAKISKLSGKPIRACGDSKQLAVIPAGDLSYKALGLNIKAGSLGNWGKYIAELDSRGIGIYTTVTNITFDQSANGVLQFSRNRFLTETEFGNATSRGNGSDVRLIVSQSRSASAPSVGLGLPALGIAAPVHTESQTEEQPAPAPIAPAGIAFPSAAAPSEPPAYATPVQAEPPKRTRRTRAEMEADKAGRSSPPAQDLSHIPPSIMATINAVGIDSPAGKALLAAYPAPAPAPDHEPAQQEAKQEDAPPPQAVGFGAATPAPQVASAQTIASGASLAEKLRAKLGVQQ